MQGDFVDITVGAEAESKTYKLPRGLLIHYSQYFQNALEGDFKEAHQNKIELSNIKCDTFESFVQYIYSGSSRIEDIDEAIDLWILGDYLGVSGVKNCAVEAIFWHAEAECWCEGPRIEPANVAKVYWGTITGAKLRKLVALFVAAELDEGGRGGKWDWGSKLKELAGDFLNDITEVLGARPHFPNGSRPGVIRQLEGIKDKPGLVYEVPSDSKKE